MSGTSNARKSELLGMPFGTANSQLRKLLLFDAVKALNRDMCYRCKNPIEHIDELSIEHINAWMWADDPKQAFFDLNNISFSHIKCNVAAGCRPNKIYADDRERNRAYFARYYAKPENKEAFLSKKRERYHQKNVKK